MWRKKRVGRQPSVLLETFRNVFVHIQQPIAIYSLKQLFLVISTLQNF